MRLLSLELPEADATGCQNLMRQNHKFPRSRATKSTLRPHAINQRKDCLHSLLSRNNRRAEQADHVSGWPTTHLGVASDRRPAEECHPNYLKGGRLELPLSCFQSMTADVTPCSVKVLRHGTLHPSLLGETYAAPPSDRAVVVRRTVSFGFAGNASPDKGNIGRSRVGTTRFSNA